MEVVMGRCFPMHGPGHTTDTSVVKGVCKDNTQHSITHNTMSDKHHYEYTTVSSPGVEGPCVTQKVVTPHQEVTHNTRDTETPSQRPASVPKTEELRVNGKPKMHSILRRSCPSENETRNADESLKTPDGKDEECASGRELSWGRKAWEITQRRKAQMREDFFKVPYEECNKEAARSLGGRLNKSEPRLHTLGKDRKKRNSLSYKRRVHFDLDDCEDEDRKPPRSKSFEAPDPPKKVVVSIYSIDKPKSVIQPEALVPCNTSGAATHPGKDSSTARTRNARPTNLDALQQKAQTKEVDRQFRADNTERPDIDTDKSRVGTKHTTTATPSTTPSTTPVTTPVTLVSTPNRPPRSPKEPTLSSPMQATTPPPQHTTPSPPHPAPIPIPRSRLTKTYSLPAHHKTTPPHPPSQPPPSRPHHLKLNNVTPIIEKHPSATPPNTTPVSTPATPGYHSAPSTPQPLNPPVPMPRKRISVSQQTPTPQTSPHHHQHQQHNQHQAPNTSHSPSQPPITSFKTLTASRNLNQHQSNPSLTSHYPSQTPNPHASIFNAVPSKNNKENEAEKSKKTNLGWGNSVNILMTKGDSYAKHKILITSHHQAPPKPTVTVRKVLIPVSSSSSSSSSCHASSRSAPSPTPSCASSSCSFGSSGSSSGCYSGSPSPTPTPSPTRIRATCTPTQL